MKGVASVIRAAPVFLVWALEELAWVGAKIILILLEADEKRC